ncbi:MAG: tRNA uridine-5-carboxymethylaminomethyl(34) synthesis GTPase MnmE, partial [Ruminococcus sp.]|nr:tRNA uridine-5-carboxymethylaminomethyl(34) synthesis GTPase MnmE [Ruminococcus sp.]
MKNSTITAISTAQGEGGIGVIRISGDDAISIADKVFKSVSGKTLSQMKGYTAALGYVYKNNEKIDETLATVFRAPLSYTGE